MTAETIACTLTNGERGDRRRRWRRLAEQASGHVVETATGLRLVLPASDNVERELRELVELERDCCAFARWTITRAASQLVLDVDGEGDAIAAVHGMLQGFRATFAGAA